MASIANYHEDSGAKLTKSGSGSLRRSRSQHTLKLIAIPVPSGFVSKDDQWMLPTPSSAHFQFIKDEDEEEEDMRRKRMQKINRTLGERIPERYFAESRRPSTSGGSGSKASRSLSRGPPADTGRKVRPELKTRASAHHLDFRDMRSTRSTVRTSPTSLPTSSQRPRAERGEFFPIPPNLPEPSAVGKVVQTKQSQQQHGIPRLASLHSHSHPVQPDQQRQSHRSKELVHKSSRSFGGNDRPLLSTARIPPVPTKPRKNGGVTRYEEKQGWSGEWNQNDMQSVIRKLRNLRFEP